MHLDVVRQWYTDNSTIGTLSVNSVFDCYTLEDRVRDAGVKVPGETAIPSGTYTVVVDFSTRFGRYMPHLLNVPMFTGIRIHSGNNDADTEGCLLVGAEKGIDCVLQSRVAFTNFFDRIAVSVGFDSTHNTPIYRTREATDITITDSPVTDERTDQSSLGGINP